MKNLIVVRLGRLKKSQGWLSKQTGLERHYVSRLVNNIKNPRIKTCTKVAKALGCKVDDVWPMESLDE